MISFPRPSGIGLALPIPISHTRTKKMAAIWCSEKNYLEEAFQYALASGDDEFMADLFEDYLNFHMDGIKPVPAIDGC